MKVILICHGNICRSVGAQYILQDMVNKAGFSDSWIIDSAATSTEEIGNPIYPPMRKALEKAGIPIGDHRARQLKRSDYADFDLIIGMDEENMFYMKQMLGDDPDHKLHYLMEYTDYPHEKIDDPWYTRQFDYCTRQLIEGCEGLLKHKLVPTKDEVETAKSIDRHDRKEARKYYNGLRRNFNQMNREMNQLMKKSAMKTDVIQDKDGNFVVKASVLH